MSNSVLSLAKFIKKESHNDFSNGRIDDSVLIASLELIESLESMREEFSRMTIDAYDHDSDLSYDLLGIFNTLYEED